MIRRAQHWTDAPLEGRARQRVMRNWCNYQSPGQPWQPTAPAIAASLDVPDNWSGDYDFARESKHAALQSFIGDSSDVDNPAMVGCRLADDPAIWLNIKACDVLRPASSAAGTKQRWDGLWRETDLECEVAPGKTAKRLILKAPGHPLLFRYTLRLADGLTLEFADNAVRVLDSKGTERMRLLAPWGCDSSTVYPSVDGRKSIGATLREGESRMIGGRLYQVVEVEVNAEDLEGAVYPVTIENDPTVQITGTTDIEDNQMLLETPNSNHGGNSGNYAIQCGIGTNLDRRSLLRVGTSAIPDGYITGFRYYIYRYPFSACTQPGNVDFYVIKDANDWVEGTSWGGPPESGASCWNYVKYDTQGWAGSGGCGLSGTDYDADGSPPTHAFSPFISGPPELKVIPLDPAWPTAWKSPTRLNNGIFLRERSGVAGASFMGASSEHATDPSYFEIDYEPPAGAAQRFFFMGSN